MEEGDDENHGKQERPDSAAAPIHCKAAKKGSLECAGEHPSQRVCPRWTVFKRERGLEEELGRTEERAFHKGTDIKSVKFEKGPESVERGRH